ncbi:MAG: hypothetical protein MMC23_004069 [Stictis urceolatum]|nr:hypothetical protein [Stictis urceolata]
MQQLAPETQGGKRTITVTSLYNIEIVSLTITWVDGSPVVAREEGIHGPITLLDEIVDLGDKSQYGQKPEIVRAEDLTFEWDPRQQAIPFGWKVSKSPTDHYLFEMDYHWLSRKYRLKEALRLQDIEKHGLEHLRFNKLGGYVEAGQDPKYVGILVRWIEDEDLFAFMSKDRPAWNRSPESQKHIIGQL